MNRTRKYLAMGLLVGLAISTGAMAQAGPWHGPGGWEPPTLEERAEHLGEKLNLDEAQKAQVLDVLTAADAEREAMRAKHEHQIRADICALATSVTEQLKAVLTKEQSAELDDLMASRAAKREEFAASHNMDHMPLPPDCDDPGM